MTKEEKQQYRDPELLKDILERTLYGLKFRLECGHHVTFGQYLGNDVTIQNGKKLTVICSQCGH